MPRHHEYAITRDSNSWHVLHICTHTRFAEDSEIIKYVRVVNEYDVALGSLEPVIESIGIENLVDNQTAVMLLNSYPKPAESKEA